MCACGPMNRRHLLVLLSGVASSALMACGGPSSGPEPVRWGKENCDFCGMLVDDPRFAAEIRAPEGRKVWKFDDIGCAALFLAKQPWKDDPRAEFWTGDNADGAWIDGRAAWYVSGPKSPMAYNYAASRSQRDGALSFAQFRRTIEEKGQNGLCQVPQSGSN
ncbi:MAG: nitrous oxide reductase accessory protein NosL [Magnetospirillum sp.]|nr:nitrous oxide reductase accessory protein NosL [Magnetospirillum sp.]